MTAVSRLCADFSQCWKGVVTTHPHATLFRRLRPHAHGDADAGLLVCHCRLESRPCRLVRVLAATCAATRQKQPVRGLPTLQVRCRPGAVVALAVIRARGLEWSGVAPEDPSLNQTMQALMISIRSKVKFNSMNS